MESRIGEINVNKYGSKMEVVKYNKYSDIWVKFNEHGVIVHTSWQAFKKGDVKNPYDKSVLGVGYIGEGKYKPSINGKLIPQYSSWRGMLERCYNEKTQEKYPTYKGCTLIEEWHNFQNYAAWYDENYYTIEGQRMCLDKDIIHKGNKIYSPETCVFVPQFINKLFTKCNSTRGDLPIGVTWSKESELFKTHCCNESKLIFLGYYRTFEEAFNVYKLYKESLIKKIADKCIDQIPQKLYQGMMDYIVEIAD